VDQFIFGRISALPSVQALVGARIYREIAPLDSALPLIVFARLDQEDLSAIGQPVTSSIFMYDIQIHAEGLSSAPLLSATEAIVDALDGVAGAVGSVYIAARKIRDTRIPTYVSDGLIHQRIGGEFELFAANN
jgi:hypothetical protein